jgi:hypothetical protein
LPASLPDEVKQRLQQRVVEHLRAEFRPQHIDVCVSNAPRSKAPLATLRINRDAANSAVVTASVDDAVTHKELARRLSLDGLPEDAHAMAIALGASELLEASWVELQLASRAAPKAEIPSGVQRRMATLDPEATRFSDLAIGGALEAFNGGIKQYGLDIQMAVALTTDLHAIASIGGRSSLATNSHHGRIVADGWVSGLSAYYVVARPSARLRLTVLGRGDFMWLNFSGFANKNATATSAAGWTWWLSGGLGLDVRVGRRVSLGGDIMAGRVMLPLYASDDGVRVFGIAKGLVATHAKVKILF